MVLQAGPANAGMDAETNRPLLAADAAVFDAGAVAEVAADADARKPENVSVWRIIWTEFKEEWSPSKVVPKKEYPYTVAGLTERFKDFCKETKDAFSDAWRDLKGKAKKFREEPSWAVGLELAEAVLNVFTLALTIASVFLAPLAKPFLIAATAVDFVLGIIKLPSIWRRSKQKYLNHIENADSGRNINKNTLTWKELGAITAVFAADVFCLSMLYLKKSPTMFVIGAWADVALVVVATVLVKPLWGLCKAIGRGIGALFGVGMGKKGETKESLLGEPKKDNVETVHSTSGRTSVLRRSSFGSNDSLPPSPVLDAARGEVAASPVPVEGAFAARGGSPLTEFNAGESPTQPVALADARGVPPARVLSAVQALHPVPGGVNVEQQVAAGSALIDAGGSTSQIHDALAASVPGRARAASMPATAPPAVTPPAPGGRARAASVALLPEAVRAAAAQAAGSDQAAPAAEQGAPIAAPRPGSR